MTDTAQVAVLTQEERAKLRAHLGYTNVSAVSTFALGIPTGIETSYMIEPAMDKVLPSAVGLLRRYVAILDQIESQMVDDMENLAVESIDEIKVNLKEQEKLERRYLYWLGYLSNLLSCPRNPFDARFGGLGGGGGINATVNHG